MATYKDVLMLVDKVSEPLKKISENAQKAQGKLSGLKDKLAGMTQGIRNAGAKIGNFAGKVAKVYTAVSAAVGLVGGAAIRATNQMAEMGDRIDKMSQKIGMSRKAFQEWDYIMSQNGGNVETLQMGFKTLTTQIEGVQKGSKESINAFSALGVSVKDTNGEFRSADDVFNDTIRKLQQIDNPTQKMILANRLFGRSAAELRPLLNQEAGAIDELRSKANAMGLIISDKDIDNAKAFKDTMDTFTRFFQAKFGTMMMQFMPSISKALEDIIAFAQENKEVFDDIGTALNFIITKALPATIKAFVGLFNVFRSIGGWVGEQIGEILSIPIMIETAFIEAQNKVLQVFIAIRQGIGEAIQFIADRLASLLKVFANILSKIPMLKGLGSMFSDIAGKVNNSVKQTQNNTTNNNSVTNNNYYGNSQKQTIGGILKPAYVR